MIFIIFCFDPVPLNKVIRVLGTLKYLARRAIRALLAFPSWGGAFTEAVNSESDIFSTFSVFELGFTLTEIFIFNTISKCLLNRYQLFKFSNRKE